MPSEDMIFYHGTRADLMPGDLIAAGHGSNYQTGTSLSHVYFSALLEPAI
jgi:Rifampin ADP-ribosyl transferase